MPSSASSVRRAAKHASGAQTRRGGIVVVFAKRGSGEEPFDVLFFPLDTKLDQMADVARDELGDAGVGADRRRIDAEENKRS